MQTQIFDWFAKNWRSLTWQAAILGLLIVGTALEHAGYRSQGFAVTAIALGLLIVAASRDHVYSIEGLKKDVLEAKLFMDHHRQALSNVEVEVSNLAHQVSTSHPLLKEDIDELAKWVRPKIGQLNDLIGAATQQLADLGGGERTKVEPTPLPPEDTVQEQNHSQKVSQLPQPAPTPPTHFQLPKQLVQQAPPPAAPASPSTKPPTASG